MKRKLVEKDGDNVKSDSSFDKYFQSSKALIAQADCMDDSEEARDHYKKAYLNCKAALKLKPDHPGVKVQIKYIKKELQRIKEAQDIDEAEESQAPRSVKSDSSFDKYFQSSKALVDQADCMDDSEEAHNHYKKAYLNCKAALKLKPDHPGVKAQIKYIKKELQRIKEAQDIDEAEKLQAPHFQEKIESSKDIGNVEIGRKILKKAKPEQAQAKQAEKIEVEQAPSKLVEGMISGLVVAHHELGDVYGLHRISVKTYIEFLEGMAPDEYESCMMGVDEYHMDVE